MIINIPNEARNNSIANLSLSHAYMLCDCEDKIEACHFSSKELSTLHPMYIIWHGPGQGARWSVSTAHQRGCIKISSELTHDDKAVALFLDKALSNIEKSRTGPY